MTVAISSPSGFTGAAKSESRGAMARFIRIAAIWAVVDLGLKAVATVFLADGNIIRLTDGLSLMLVYNVGGAGGLMIGPYTGLINVLVTLLAVAMVFRIVTPIAQFDARSVLALGLVTGGALGNLASMLTGPKGVADFLSISIGSTTSIVINGADMLLWTGALLLIPVVAKLAAAVLSESLRKS